MADIMDAYWRAPAIARTFATAVLATSIACHMGIMPYSWIYFHYLELFRLPPQIWRVVTSFLLTSPQLGIVMDTYFIFQYASQLETTHPKFGRKEDFLWYLVFCGTVIIVGSTPNTSSALPFPVLPIPQLHTSYICPDSEVPLLLSRFLERREITPALRPVRHSQYLVKGRFAVWAWWDVSMDDSGLDLCGLGWFRAPYITPLPSSLAVVLHCSLSNPMCTANKSKKVLAQYFLGSLYFLQALILAMCYTATQDQRGQKAGFFFFTVPAQLIPLCMMGASLLMAGPHVMLLQLTGLVAAHLHDFLTRLWPEFGGGANWIPTPAFFARLVTTPRFMQREYGTAIRNDPSAGTSTGAQGRGPLPDSWKTRGSGHRLG